MAGRYSVRLHGSFFQIYKFSAGNCDLRRVWAGRDYKAKGEKYMQNSETKPIQGVDKDGLPIYADETTGTLKLSSDMNVLGVRQDVFGWAFLHENERYNDTLKPDYDPGNFALCPFCCKQVGEGSRVRTFYPQRVMLQSGLLQGSESSRLRFFYRYHEGCFHKTDDQTIEESLKAMQPPAKENEKDG